MNVLYVHFLFWRTYSIRYFSNLHDALLRSLLQQCHWLESKYSDIRVCKRGGMYNEAVPRTQGSLLPMDQSSQSLASVNKVSFTHSYGHSFLLVEVLATSQPQQEPCMTHKL